MLSQLVRQRTLQWLRSFSAGVALLSVGASEAVSQELGASSSSGRTVSYVVPTLQEAASTELSRDFESDVTREPLTSTAAGNFPTAVAVEDLSLRERMAQQGLNWELYGTQFYQGVAAGGREQDWEYGGKFDYLLHADGNKLGLWQGFFVDLHGESRLGKSVNNVDGLLAPSNIAMNFPAADGNVTALTGLKVTQALSEDFALFAGKINTLDEYPLRFSPEMGLGRPGIGGFMNTSLVFNPIAARTLTYSAVGAGAAILQDGQPFFVMSVFDPEERATIGAADLYERGVVLVPDLTLRVKVLELPGLYNFGGTYSNARYRSVDPAAYLFIPDLGIVGGEETGSWSLYSNFYQAIWMDPCDSDRTWGVFGQFGVSDGNPNPIQYVANGGLAGRSMLAHRKLDTFGAGFFYMGLSGEFKALAAPILPQQNEYGVEFFYNMAVTEACRLTADIQVARPSTVGFDTAIVPGLRMEVIF